MKQENPAARLESPAFRRGEEVKYSGRDEDGCHIWATDQPFDPLAGDRLQVELMPGRTGITFPVGGVL